MRGALSRARKLAAVLSVGVGGALCLGALATVTSAQVMPPSPSADDKPPSAPAGLSVSPAGPGSLALDWDASSDDVGVAGYELYLNGSKVDSTQATGYTFTGLACGIKYALGVDAYDDAGNRSPIASRDGTTGPCVDTKPPSNPAGLGVSPAGPGSLALDWDASSDDVGVAGYELYLNGSKVDSTQATGYTFGGLACGSKYAVGVDAYDDAGNRSSIASRDGTTGPCVDTKPPSNPAGLGVSPAGPGSLALDWNASSDDVGVAGYELYLNGSKVDSTQATGYTFGGLACGSKYALGVDAYDDAGNRSSIASRDGTTASCGSEPVNTSPPTVSGSAVVGSQLTASPGSWSGSPTAYGYEWRRCDAAGGGCAAVAGATAASYTPTGGDAGATLLVAVTAAGAGGSATALSAPSGVIGDATAPSVPGGLSVSSSSASIVSVSWSASSDDVGVAGYGLYLNGAYADTTSATSYTFGGLACGTNYTLGIDAYDAAGNRSVEAVVSTTTGACPDTQPPMPPLALTQTGASASSISFAWSPSLDDVGVVGYAVYTNDAAAGTTQATSYILTGLSCGQSYTIAVAADDAAGNESLRTSAAMATAACPPLPPANTLPPTITGTTVVGSLLSASSGTWSGKPTSYAYRWRRCDSSGNACADIAAAGASTYTLAGADEGATLRVAVTAANSGGSSTAESAPTTLVAAAPVPVAAPDFSADPNLTGTLLPWDKFDAGDAASTDGIWTSMQLFGASWPGIVAVTDDPLGQQGKVYQQTVTPIAHASNASTSDSTYLFNYPKAYLGANGQDNWIHFRMMLPADYVPTAGEWNIFNEFHNNSRFQTFYNQGLIGWEYPELVLYVTNYTADVPHLMYRVRGGIDGASNFDGTDIMVDDQLQLGHWYDILLHVVWSPNASIGVFEWWLDGKVIASIRRPTLWQRPDGSTDHVELELNNYRAHATWNATVYYSKLKVGTTQASVGF